jgi:ABC-type uncharacterized transport system substrate-binding protein
MFECAADLVEGIARSKPSEIPIEQTTGLELVINPKSVKALNPTIPQNNSSPPKW